MCVMVWLTYVVFISDVGNDQHEMTFQEADIVVILLINK